MSDEVHAKIVIDALQRAGETVYVHDASSDNGRRYEGLNARRLAALIDELAQHRERAARVRIWMSQNAAPSLSAPGMHPVDAMLDLVTTCRSAIQACMPVVMTLWSTIASRLAAAGVKLPPGVG
jgi:hypothetical protein